MYLNIFRSILLIIINTVLHPPKSIDRYTWSFVRKRVWHDICIILIVDNFLEVRRYVPREDDIDSEICNSLLILGRNFWYFQGPQKQLRLPMIIRHGGKTKVSIEVSVSYHSLLSSRGNSMAQSRMKGVGAHLRALVYE